MKAIVVHEAGGPGNLILEERSMPQVRDGWSLVWELNALGYLNGQRIL